MDQLLFLLRGSEAEQIALNDATFYITTDIQAISLKKLTKGKIYVINDISIDTLNSCQMDSQIIKYFTERFSHVKYYRKAVCICS